MDAKKCKSGIIVVHKERAGYLIQAVESLLAQTEPLDEILIGGDGVNDEVTKQALGMCERLDRSVRVFHFPKNGISIVSNKLIELSRGDYIFRQDSDDWSHRERVQLETVALEAFDIVGCSIRLIDEMGSQHSVLVHPEEPSPEYFAREPEHSKSYGWIVNNGGSVMRREVWNKLGGFTPYLQPGQDVEFWRRAYLNGFKFFNIDRVLYTARIREQKYTAL